MTWATPKTDWDTDDVIGAADLNRIEENIERTNGSSSDITGMSTVASANNFVPVKRFTVVTGTTDIHYLPDSFSPGAVLYLFFTSNVYLAHLEGSPPAGYKEIKTATGLDILGAASSIGILNFDGDYWYIITA